MDTWDPRYYYFTSWTISSIALNIAVERRTIDRCFASSKLERFLGNRMVMYQPFQYSAKPLIRLCNKMKATILSVFITVKKKALSILHTRKALSLTWNNNKLNVCSRGSLNILSHTDKFSIISGLISSHVCNK